MRTFQIRQREDQAFSAGSALNYYQLLPVYYHHHYSLSCSLKMIQITSANV